MFRTSSFTSAPEDRYQCSLFHTHHQVLCLFSTVGISGLLKRRKRIDFYRSDKLTYPSSYHMEITILGTATYFAKDLPCKDE